MRKSIAVLSALVLGALCAQAAPNIIYILADDLGMGDLSCYGQRKLETPNIDSLAKGGMRFLRHYSGSTVCAPSRCSLMTGLHTGHSYIRGNMGSSYSPDGDKDMPAETFTLAKSLKAAGYATGIFGKWGLGAQESPSAPFKMGFERFYGYNGQVPAHNYYPAYLWSDSEKVMFPENANGARKTYSADLIQAESVKFIKKNMAEKKPFFVYYATTIPHAEMWTEPKYMDSFKGEFGDEKPYVSNSKRVGAYTSQPEPRAAFAGMIKALDTYVGEIIALLEKENALEDTLIIFTSDNGAHREGGHDPDFWNSSGGLRGGKRDMYEGGIRTPMLAFWKGKIAAGSVNSHVSAFWDVFETLAEISGAQRPAQTDGISFAPTLLGKGAQNKHDYLYWEFFEQGGKQAIIKGDYKLIKLNVNKPSETKWELYDLSKDPAEKDNLASSMPEKLAELKPVLENARTTSPIERFNFKK